VIEKPSAQPNEPAWLTALGLARSAQRCGARTRRGSACQCPAIGGRKRCRLHGGLSPGAPLGARNGAWRHGGATNEAKAQRKAVRALLREARKMLDGDT
jgi:hypothetical protein